MLKFVKLTKSKICFFLVNIVAILPLTAFAIGLGQMHVYSHIGENLHLEIELNNSRNYDLSQLQASLASDDDYILANLEKTYDLKKLKFAIKQLKSGKKVIVVDSDYPINSPILEILLYLKWPQSGMIKDYMVFLSPSPLSNVKKVESLVQKDSKLSRISSKLKKDVEPVPATIAPKPVPGPILLKNSAPYDADKSETSSMRIDNKKPDNSKMNSVSSNEKNQASASEKASTKVQSIKNKTIAVEESLVIDSTEDAKNSETNNPQINHELIKNNLNNSDISSDVKTKSKLEFYIFTGVILLLSAVLAACRAKVRSFLAIFKRLTGRRNFSSEKLADDFVKITTEAAQLRNSLNEQDELIKKMQDSSNDCNLKDEELESKLELVTNYYMVGDYEEAILLANEIKASGNKKYIKKLSQIEEKYS